MCHLAKRKYIHLNFRIIAFFWELGIFKYVLNLKLLWKLSSKRKKNMCRFHTDFGFYTYNLEIEY